MRSKVSRQQSNLRKSNIVMLLCLLLCLLMLVSCQEKKKGEAWPEHLLSLDILPKMQTGYVDYYTFENRLLRIYVFDVDKQDVDEYISVLNVTGYAVVEKSSDSYEGSLNGYMLNMYRIDELQRLAIELLFPMKWPDKGYVSSLPPPDAIVILETVVIGDNITVVAEDIGKDAFIAYTEIVKELGYADILIETDTHFSARKDGYTVVLARDTERQVIDIGVYDER